MRISSSMVAGSYLADLHQQQEQLYKVQREAATNKRIVDPSDDPGGSIQASGLHTQKQVIDQYLSNLDDARQHVEHSETVVTTAQALISSAHKLALKGAGDTSTADARAALGKQVNDLLEEAATQANDSYLGTYTMAGVNTNTAPYTVTRDVNGQITSVAAPAASVSGWINRQIGTAVVKVNLNGSDVFGGAGSPVGSVDYFQTLVQLRDALNSNNGPAVTALMPQLTKLEDQVGVQLTVTGAGTSRLDRLQSALESQSLDTQKHLSSLEDADTARVAIDLQTAQAVYQQALQIGNKILSLGLGSLLG